MNINLDQDLDLLLKISCGDNLTNQDIEKIIKILKNHDTKKHIYQDYIRCHLDNINYMNIYKDHMPKIDHTCLFVPWLVTIKYELCDLFINIKNKYPNQDVNVEFRIYTALNIAIKHDKINLVKFLLNHNALVNKQNIYGSTALHVSINTNKINLDMLSLLLEYGADINIKNNHGLTPQKLINYKYGSGVCNLQDLMIMHIKDPGFN